jgi:hypothetical protein
VAIMLGRCGLTVTRMYRHIRCHQESRHVYRGLLELQRGGGFNIQRLLVSSTDNAFGSDSSSLSYCESLVKQYENDNYIAGLLMPRGLRPFFYSIRAFNVEIAAIKDQSHGNTMTSRIRFQWWRDFFRVVYDSGAGAETTSKLQDYRSHPVAKQLERHIVSNKLSRSWFERSLEARYV